MPRRKSMRRIRDCLRLYHECGLSQVQIARTLRLARSTVGDYLGRGRESCHGWEELRLMDDSQLEALLFTRPEDEGPSRPEPDWEDVHVELRSHKSVTLHHLWEEYRDTHPEGYSYPRFCVRYRQWAVRCKVYMHQHHVGGETLYVDYSGKKPRIRDPHTGQEREVELLVMAWGASHYVYTEAQESQTLPDWIMGHRRGYEFFGCAPHIEVDDNLKSAVNKACRYDPDINRSFTEFTEHYGVAVVPARPYKARDKAKVENAVLIAQRWIVACLRHKVFFSLLDLNAAIRSLLEKLNDKPLQKLRRSRREVFLELDKPNALPLPSEAFEYREWTYPSVAFDYHVQVDKHYYSAPWTLARQKVSVRLTENVVEVFHKRDRVALHQRSRAPYGYTTQREHMPPAHQKHIEWNPGRLYQWAGQIGPDTRLLIERVVKTKFHPQQGFRPALGILRLAKTYGDDRLEAAAGVALTFGFVRVQQIADLLKHNKEKKPGPTLTVPNARQARGRQYYAEQSAQQILPV